MHIDSHVFVIIFVFIPFESRFFYLWHITILPSDSFETVQEQNSYRKEKSSLSQF